MAMFRTSKPLALSIGTLAAIATTVLAQGQGSSPSRSPATSTDNRLVVAGSLTWLSKSDVAAKQDGVLYSIEFDFGMRVQEGQVIGELDDTLAKLNVEKAQVVAKSTGALAKAQAQQQQAVAERSRYLRLAQKPGGLVSQAELDKAAADVNFADALIQEAQEKRLADSVELKQAEQILEFHKIRAPFNGVVIDKLKYPGEAVRQHEAIVRLGKTDKFRFGGWVPLKEAHRVRQNDLVQFSPTIDGANLPIESKVFEGRVISIGPEVTADGAYTRVLAEIINPPSPDDPTTELSEGMRGEATIFLGGGTAPAAAPVPAGAAAPPPTATRTR
jgi:RND family efflux transporter MFP subunit